MEGLDMRAPRRELLDSKGRLRYPLCGAEDTVLYNKECLRRPSRRKEWEFYRLLGPGYALQLSYGHTGSAALAEAELINMNSGRSWGQRELKLFPGDSFDLDFSAGEPHSVKYEDKDFFLSFSFDGRERRLCCECPELSAELRALQRGDGLLTAFPFSGKGEFSLQYRHIFPEIQGEIQVKGRQYPVDSRTFLFLRSCRGIWPRESGWVWGSGCGRLGNGQLLGLSLGWGGGRCRGAGENVLFLDGRLQTLGRLRRRGSREDLMAPCTLEEENGLLQLEFIPQYDKYKDQRGLLSRCRVHQLFGELRGTVLTPDGRPREAEGLPFVLEQAECRW